QRPTTPRDSSAERLCLPRQGLRLAQRRRQGHHRLPLQRLPLLPTDHQRDWQTRRHAMNAHAPKTVRCAIYTRKSTEEGLQKEFNSLDAQREAAEAYIRSQAQEGWICLPDCYDD